MQKLRTIAAAAAVVTAGAPFTASTPGAAACIGVTEGIARWMAGKAAADSARTWAVGQRQTPPRVQISYSGLSCAGKAKACR